MYFLHALLCQMPILTMGKNFVTFLYGNFPLRVLLNVIERVIAIIIMGISHNSYSKYLLYCIYQYSHWEIPIMTMGKKL